MSANQTFRRAPSALASVTFAISLLGVQSAHAQLTTLYDFTNDGSDARFQPNGAIPNGALVELSPGVFWGTTYFGGQEQPGFPDWYQGVVFKISVTSASTANYQVVAALSTPNEAFAGPNLVSPASPAGDGDLYGVTTYSDDLGDYYRFNPRTAQFDFNDPFNYYYHVEPGIDAALYSETFGGVVGVGSVFIANKTALLPGVISASGDGDLISAPMVQVGDLNLFGPIQPQFGSGTSLARVGPDTAGYLSVIESSESIDPGYNVPSLVAEPACYLGGPCRLWGLSPNIGPNGSLFVSDEDFHISRFDLSGSDFNPASAGLTWTTGNLIVITSHSGAKFGLGGVYKFDIVSSQFSKVLDFTANQAGLPTPSLYANSLVQGSDGRLYGASSGYAGGNPPTCLASNTFCGSIYMIDMHLPAPSPIVTGAYPNSGSVGSVTVLRGFNLLNTIAVRLGGIACAFETRNAGTLQVTIPPRAATGTISVTTSNGTAQMQGVFTVN